MKNKALFFDTGPIISLVMSGLVWILKPLKERFRGGFYITPGVQRELVERPLKVRRFEFEALQVVKLIREGVLEVYGEVPYREVEELEELADSSFKVRKKNLDIVQSGEIEAVASAGKMRAEGVVMDERTLRLFIENNKEMEKLLEIRFREDVVPDWDKIREFSKRVEGIKIIRSIELVGTAYKLGILNEYIPQLAKGKEILLDSVLWATKFNGCAVTGQEIEEMKKFLL